MSARHLDLHLLAFRQAERSLKFNGLTFDYTSALHSAVSPDIAH